MYKNLKNGMIRFMKISADMRYTHSCKKRYTLYKFPVLSGMKLAALLFTAALFFYIAGCSHKNSVVTRSTKNHKKRTTPVLEIAEDMQNRAVVLFLGYGFNENDQRQKIESELKEYYRFLSDENRLHILSYPDDVRVAGKIRLQSIVQTVKTIHESTPVCAFITLGSPQGMHSVLASLQDTDMGIPVFSIFSQDDVLGTEAGSDFVMDYRSGAEKNASGIENVATEDSELHYSGQPSDILIPLVYAAFNWKSVKDSASLIPILRTEFLKRTGCHLMVYVDPETTLRSKNHYVLDSSTGDKE